FGGIPATGAIARTATNIKNGGRTPVAGMGPAPLLFLIFLFARPLAEKIPPPRLAGVPIVGRFHLSGWRSFRSLLAGPRSDVAVLLTTFSLTILVDLTVAVEVGMVLAAFLFMKHMADATQVRAWSQELEEPENGRGGEIRPNHVPEGVEVF